MDKIKELCMKTGHYFFEALIKAIKVNNYGDVKDLVDLINKKYPASLFACDEEKKTALHLALASGNHDMSNFLFERMKNNEVIYTQDQELRTVFWYAANDSFSDIFIKLLKQATEDNKQALFFVCDKDKSTLLHKTAESGQHDIINILFSQVISNKDKEFINQPDNDSNTALHKSYQGLLARREKAPKDEEAVKRYIQIVVELFQNGAEIHLLNNENTTALMLHRQLSIRDQEHILHSLKGKETVDDSGDINDVKLALMTGQEIILAEMPRAFEDKLEPNLPSGTVKTHNAPAPSSSSSITYHYQHSNNNRIVLNKLIKQMEAYLADLQGRAPEADPMCRAATITIPTGSIGLSLILFLYFIYRAIEARQALDSQKMLDYHYYKAQEDLYQFYAFLTPWVAIPITWTICAYSTRLWNIEKKISHLEYQSFIERLEIISNQLAALQSPLSPIHPDIHLQLLRDISLLKHDQSLQESINILLRCIDALKVIRQDVTNNKQLSAFSIFSHPKETVIDVHEETPLQQTRQLTYGGM